VDESQTIRITVEEAATLLGIEKGSVKPSEADSSPRGPRGSPEPGEGQQGSRDPQQPQATTSRPWWRRIFSG
jgi:hypothetical protein